MAESKSSVERTRECSAVGNNTEKNSEAAAYLFFCHTFEEQKSDHLAESTSSKTDSDCIINIDDDSKDPLVEGQIVHVQEDPSLLYVPQDTEANSEEILPDGLRPRLLEEEGLYVGERLQIVKKMYDKMSHRLLDEYEGQRWFGKDGCMDTVPNPLKNYWQAIIDSPFPSTSDDLTTAYIKPVGVSGSGGGRSETKPAAGPWQLDLNLKGLQFTQHPLFAKEHVLANRLQRLCENYTSGGGTDKATLLQEKLRALRNSKMQMSNHGPRSLSGSKAITKQIRETQRMLNHIMEDNAAELKKIISTWQCLKALRAQNGHISTSAKLHFQKVALKEENGSSVHYDGSDADSETENNRDEEGANGSTFLNDDSIFNTHSVADWLQDVLNTHSQREKAVDAPHLTTLPAKRSHIPFIPVLTMNQPISPDLSCDGIEQCRRAALRELSISVKIFYNGKLVSATPKSPLDLNFRVHIEETFSMQVTNRPESLMLEVYEHEKFRNTLLAEVYLPIPHRNVLSSSAVVETLQFGSERRAGSSLLVSAGDRSLWMGTTAKLCYMLSWAVDEWGFPKAPPTEPAVPPPFGDSVAARLNRQQFEWLMKLQFDPNDPANSRLHELIRELQKMEKENSGGYFRLEEPHDSFATDEQLDRVWRFQLLRLRESVNTPEALRTRPIPLHERNITKVMLEEYTAGQVELPPRRRDDFTGDRMWVIQYLQQLISDIEKNMQLMEKKYKLSDIVWEHHDAGEPFRINWDMFRRPRQLKPRRQAVERVSPGQLPHTDPVVRVNIQSAMHLPVRQQSQRDMENRGAYCDMSSGTSSLTRSTYRSSPKLQPFVEVTFQGATFQTREAEGPDPIWREEFTFLFCSPGGDYSHAGLAKNQDDIIIDVFDVVSFQLTERDTLRGCGAHTYFGKQWLGSVTVPFRALLQQHKLECSVQIRIPHALLGYMWASDQVDEHQDQASFLRVLIALEPPISSKDEPSALEITQRSTWMIPADESKDTVQLACEFDRKCRPAGGHKRLVSFVLNSKGELALATRFFRPLLAPPGILHRDGDEQFDNEKLTLLHQRRLAAFVSLIPVLPSTSEVGDYGEMWFTSEQCLDLGIGNSTSLAVLLCNLFLHMEDMKAWVVLGSSVTEDRTAFVYSSHPYSKELLWNPKDGRHYSVPLSHPITKVDYLVNWQNVWFYKSRVSPVPLTFQLSNASDWIHLFPESSQPVSGQKAFATQYRLPEPDLVDDLQSSLGKQLMRSVMEWRSPHPTRWNRKCPMILHRILPQLDAQQDLATPHYMQEVAHMVAAQMPGYKVTGMAFRMGFSGVDAVVEQVRHTQIHSTEIPGTEFALAVYIRPYPNNVLAVWVFLTALVKDQKGPFYLPPCHNEHKEHQ
ncbi:protein CC2D2B-like isoform X2 [Engraulis encrasicolus]|uniref:protein CC2D2B-like isoform X2 n=1 Tax=Engraulis encrasicolus TaxID=184585 RepID=UPI002FD61EEE